MRIAFLDLDHTLLAADSNELWMEHLLAQGLVSPDRLAEHDRFVADYAQGRLDFPALQRFRIAVDAALASDRLRQEQDRFRTETLLPAIAPQAPSLVAQLARAGLHTVLVSATRASLVEPVASHLGIAVVLASDSQPQVTDDCFGPGKIAHVNHWLARQGLSLQALAESWFYSDSRNDLPLLQAVQKPVAVDPDPVLRAHAEAAGWPILSLRHASQGGA